MKAFFISIPHSGERVPKETPWLSSLSEPILMCDVDRFVERLYKEAIAAVHCPSVVTEWNRYVVDLNRLADDIDPRSVIGAAPREAQLMQGVHWVKTTTGETLMKEPMTMDLHLRLIKNYFEPFHVKVKDLYQDFKKKGAAKVFHLDAHSMPSVGNSSHRDPGQKRAEVVVSDDKGKSCEPFFKDLVVTAFEKAGFKVAYNWPYFGGGVTQTYGKPVIGQHAIQVELNRSLYMDELTKQLRKGDCQQVATRIATAVQAIERGLPEFT